MRGNNKSNIVAAFRRMLVSPAKHSYVRLPRKCDYRTDRQTDAGQSDPYVPLCFAVDTTRKVCHSYSVIGEMVIVAGYLHVKC